MTHRNTTQQFAIVFNTFINRLLIRFLFFRKGKSTKRTCVRVVLFCLYNSPFQPKKLSRFASHRKPLLIHSKTFARIVSGHVPTSTTNTMMSRSNINFFIAGRYPVIIPRMVLSELRKGLTGHSRTSPVSVSTERTAYELPLTVFFVFSSLIS